MSTVLITGMTASQVKPVTRAGVKTLAGALKTVLEELGHTVDLRPFVIADEEVKPYDHVLVGLGPLKGVGTSYMYEAIQAIDIYSDIASVALFCDDTSTAKIGREFKTITKRPSDYTKPFFMYKREWSLVQPGTTVNDRHLSVIKRLAGMEEDDWYWPVLMPSWSFDHAYVAAAKICSQAAHNVVSFDPTAYFTGEIGPAHSDRDDHFWVTTMGTDSTTIKRMTSLSHWDVVSVSTDYSKILGASAMLVPSSIWSPDIQLASSLNIPVATDWRVLGPLLGVPFEVLPENIEAMTDDERAELAKSQHDALQSHAVGKSTSEVLTKWIEGEQK